MLNAKTLIGTHDLLFITFDSLRYDVAVEGLRQGITPTLASVLPASGWEERQTPGNFTLAAHQAFFAGFLPTPSHPGRHPRLFAAAFKGSESTAPGTFAFAEPTLPQALAKLGYRTLCVGGVGFFNKQTALGRVLPNLFEHSIWWPTMSPVSPTSTKVQVDQALKLLGKVPGGDRVFLFMNLSATHQPTHIFVQGAQKDSFETQLAALAYADSQLAPLFEAMRDRGSSLAILCADHGEAFGEDGYWGHRINHPKVLTVPYAEFILPEGRAI